MYSFPHMTWKKESDRCAFWGQLCRGVHPEGHPAPQKKKAGRRLAGV